MTIRELRKKLRMTQKEFAKENSYITRELDGGVRGERCDVRERDKPRAYDEEDAERIECERNALGVPNTQKHNEDDECNSAVHKEPVDVEYGSIREHEIGHRIARLRGRVVACKVVEVHATHKNSK